MKRNIALLLISILCLGLYPVTVNGKVGDIEPKKPCTVAQFSGEGEDFEVGNAIHFCPFDAACAGTGLYDQLSKLRQVREQVLNQTKVGRKYVLLLGEFGAELAQLVLENPDLAEGVRDITRILLPKAKDLLSMELDNPNILLDQDDAVKIKILAMKFEEKASPELQKEIKKGQFELDQYVDKTVMEIMELLKGDSLVRNGKKLRALLPVTTTN